ncbi:MAG: hypothetical protein BGP21_11560 [Thiobacillus sp. 65-29]|nr:MAG: hypothetical protein BGP21_11560 [Thiobacillus sp. 65-29]
MASDSLLAQLDGLNEQQLRRLLVEHLTKQKLGLYWEANAIERDAALNADIVLPRLVEDWSCNLDAAPTRNLVIEGDNFDGLRLLRATHRGKIRVIYIDPPYNTGNKDWVYNDRYVGANDRWRHSQWLEFLYRRLMLARDLLTPDGVILVSINDENRARLELLMDEVFPGMRVGSLVWKKRKSSNTSLDYHYSSDHEHVLIYAGPGFVFNGSSKTWDGYQNWDEDKQNWWSSGPLTLGFTKDQRPNLFYPLRNPATDIWYPCDPKRVWVYASKTRLGDKKVRTRPMEEMIEHNLVNFPDEPTPAFYASEAELRTALESGLAPPYLDTSSDLLFWVGKKIAFGRPRFKRFKDTLVNESMPLSSWCVDLADPKEGGEISVVQITSGRTSEGTMLLRELGMAEDFPYSKPLSLIKNLLQQTTRSNDIVLDFFAGSGTTGQAVLELNAEDGGGRSFILCSSTEVTAKEPDKNLCRDVCAERMRRVIAGYGGKPGYTPEQGGQFAYLQLDKVDAADAHVEIDESHAFQLLALKRFGAALPVPDGTIKRLGRVADCEVLLCGKADATTLKTLAAWPEKYGAARLAIYTTRPETLRDKLAARGIEVNCYSLMDALTGGQGGAT